MKSLLLLVALFVWVAACDDDTAGNNANNTNSSNNANNTNNINSSNNANNTSNNTSNSNNTNSSNNVNNTNNGVDVDTARCETSESVHVAKSGENSATCGSATEPCLTIAHGLSMAQYGDAVCVHEGTYEEGWLEVPGGVTLISRDGALRAVINSGTLSAVRFTDFNNDAGIDGFEVYGSWDQGEAGDGLIRVHDAENITIRNVMAHDAPFDQDVIKVSGQVSNLLIERVVAWNPAHRASGDGAYYQEVIDIFGSGAELGDPRPVSNVIVRNCWLFHVGDVGDWLIYSKIYAENIMYENNVFGPSAGQGWANAAVGIGTGEQWSPDPTVASVVNAIVRNNIFVGLKGDAAFALMNPENSWVYNNLFYANSGDSLRSVIMTRDNQHPVVGAYFFNNIFTNNHPSKDNAGRLFWIRGELPSPLSIHHNIYHDSITATDADYENEPSSFYDQDPLLSAPAIPDTTQRNLERVAEIQATFTLQSGSPALAAGTDVVAEQSHPNWDPGETDKKWSCTQSPRNQTWDIGPHQTAD